MSKGIVFCRDEQGVDDAASIMESKKIRRLPVITRTRGFSALPARKSQKRHLIISRTAVNMIKGMPAPKWWIGAALRAAAGGVVCLVFLTLPASTSMAAEIGGGPDSSVVFLAQVVVLLLVGRLLGEAMQRIGQPAVMGQLIAGVLLGPSVFGVIWPDAQHWIFPNNAEQKKMLEAVSQLGILMLL